MHILEHTRCAHKMIGLVWQLYYIKFLQKIISTNKRDSILVNRLRHSVIGISFHDKPHKKETWLMLTTWLFACSMQSFIGNWHKISWKWARRLVTQFRYNELYIKNMSNGDPPICALFTGTRRMSPFEFLLRIPQYIQKQFVQVAVFLATPSVKETLLSIYQRKNMKYSSSRCIS